VLSPAAKFTHYEPLFPEAVERIYAAVKFLQGKGYKRIAFVGHSLGSRMVNEYMWRDENNSALFAWASIGMVHGTYDKPVHIPVPVLDLYTEKDYNVVLWYVNERIKELQQVKVKGSKQIMEPGAEHFFEGHEKQLIEYVRRFFDDTLAARIAQK
jgi:alpha/beta superfamily hydrolase